MPRSSLTSLVSLLLAAVPVLAGCDPADLRAEDTPGAVLPRSAIDCLDTPDSETPGDPMFACGDVVAYPCLPHQDTADKADEEAYCSEIWLDGVDGPVGVITRPGGRHVIAACDDDDACSIFADGDFRCELGMCVGSPK